MNKYKKVVDLDYKIKKLRGLIKNISKGVEYVDGSIVGSLDFYTTVSANIKSKWGSFQYQNDTVEYNILARIIIHFLFKEIEELEKEKEDIINPWYRRLFK